MKQKTQQSTTSKEIKLKHLHMEIRKEIKYTQVLSTLSGTFL